MVKIYQLPSIPRSGKSLGEGNGYPLQYSCLENSMNRGAWWATVHGIAELDTIERVTLTNNYWRKGTIIVGEIFPHQQLSKSRGLGSDYWSPIEGEWGKMRWNDRWSIIHQPRYFIWHKNLSTKALGRKTAWKGEILKIPEVNFMEILNIKKLFIFGYTGLLLLCGLPLAAASGGCPSLWCVGFSLRWLLIAGHGLYGTWAQ